MSSNAIRSIEIRPTIGSVIRRPSEFDRPLWPHLSHLDPLKLPSAASVTCTNISFIASVRSFALKSLRADKDQHIALNMTSDHIRVPTVTPGGNHRAQKTANIAPSPPPGMQGSLGYGYKIDPRLVDKLLSSILVEEGPSDKIAMDKLAAFTYLYSKAVGLFYHPNNLRMATRPDMQKEDFESLRGFFIVLATPHSLKVPSRKRIDRLKKFLETDEEPQWCEIDKTATH